MAFSEYLVERVRNRIPQKHLIVEKKNDGRPHFYGE